MTQPSAHRIARLTGAAYLGIIVSGIFAEFVVRMSLVDPSDAAATARNIASSAGLFRASIAADLLMIALDIGVAVGFYALLRPVHRHLALLATALRLIQAAVLAANSMNLVSALHWATGGAGAPGLSAGSREALVLAAMESHGVVYDVGLVFFGLACLVLGHSLRVSGLLAAHLGIGLSLAGVVYLAGSLSVILAPGVASFLEPMYGLALAAELAVAGRLLTRGARGNVARGASAVARIGQEGVDGAAREA